MPLLYIAAVSAPPKPQHRETGIFLLYILLHVCIGFDKDRWICVAQLCSGTDKSEKSSKQWLSTM